jgi:hypothetical protein
MHTTHAPPLHTRSVPHDDPLGALPDSRQIGAPVLHAVVPVRHGLPDTTHDDPATQSMQVPVALHTLSCAHEPPGGSFMPVSTHVGVAPEQSSLPA